MFYNELKYIFNNYLDYRLNNTKYKENELVNIILKEYMENNELDEINENLEDENSNSKKLEWI